MPDDSGPQIPIGKESHKKPPITGLELTHVQIAKLFKILDATYEVNTGAIELPEGAVLKVEFMEHSTILIKLFDANKVLVSDFECFLKYGFIHKDVQDHKPEWVMVHRFVAKEYRGQKIGPKMLKIIEQCVSHIAERSKKMQTIVIDAYQLEIIDFALKNGYIPATEEDKANAQAVLSNDRSGFIIADAPAQPNHSEQRQNFIYSLDKLKRAAEVRELGDMTKAEIESKLGDLMENDFYAHKANALVINFKKEIKPKT
jgi:GNAT superfamily N-acetyltransferase